MDILDFEQLFEKGFGSWRENSVFVAAVSGGADSTAMLVASAGLARKRNYRIHCLHVRHNIRSPGEGEKDLQAVLGLCKRLQIPCRVVSIKPGKIEQRARKKGLGTEAAAREYRHAAFRHEAKRVGAEKVLVAHNKDDVLENSIMRIFRGSGPRGLASMPASTSLILRPLLHISRQQILVYLDRVHESYQTDLSNYDTRYFRNRVRYTLIPVLDKHFPFWKEGIEALGNTQAYIADYLETQARESVEWCIRGNWVETSGDNFDLLNPVIQEEAIFQGLEKLLNLSAGKTEIPPADYPRRYRVPRRVTLRQFIRRGHQVLDLGKVRLRRSGKLLQILMWEDPLLVRGGACSAEKPGNYRFMDYSIRIDEEPGPGLSFYCELPVVFRIPLPGEKIHHRDFQKIKTRDMKNSIIAEDRNGKIAYIWVDQNNIKTLLCNEENTVYKTAVSVNVI